MVIVPKAEMALPPLPELLHVIEPSFIIRFPSVVKHVALYESVTLVAFLYVAPVPEVEIFTVPLRILISASAEMPFPAAPVAIIVIVAPEILMVESHLIAVQ
ncbi:MAG: hypothetical protein BWY67_02161 [Bacteroidetes bacterium ADurb.Bin397]|nr:MAG: hypothetical protein BWY67_02161 [Bacteroidetes bacterium ADurb.Bin397]